MERTVECKKISLFQNLSEEFIDKYKDDLDWTFVLQRTQLSSEFLEKHLEYIDWNHIYNQKHLSEKFIEKYYFEHKSFESALITFKLSETFIEKHLSDFNESHIKDCMYFIVRFQEISEEFILKYLDFIDIKYLVTYQKLSESLLNEIWSKIVEKECVEDVLERQKLSESFIMNHKSDINYQWNLVLEYQKVSEAFIEKLLEMNYIKLRG